MTRMQTLSIFLNEIPHDSDIVVHMLCCWFTAGPHMSVVQVGHSGDFSPTKVVPMESRTSRNQKPDITAKPRDVTTTTTMHAKSPAPRPAAPRNVVIVKGINQKTDQETLEMFFESKKRSSGGPVDNVDYKRIKQEATVTFHNVEGTLYIVFVYKNYRYIYIYIYAVCVYIHEIIRVYIYI